ncbi:restriction endonuclease subunit S [Floridanema evergladense]|uniref:Restriction endonuclease subunit S n=1 Tax=Floridaenema evergladense BLCC-F167 TaxID=3153639 RepID=A0ABV4WNW8_9CYAN
MRFTYHHEYGRAGGAQPNVNATLLSAILLPIPPLEEQKRIAVILNEKMEAIERSRQATLAQLEAINKLPSAFLRQAFNGEL